MDIIVFQSHPTDSIRNLSSKHNPTVPMEAFLSAEKLDQRNFKEKHAIAIKLRDLCTEAGTNDQELFKQIDNVTQSCDTCDRYEHVPLCQCLLPMTIMC